MTFKIATWNVNSLRVRLPHVLQWLEQHQPDVLALQETKLIDADFPFAAINEAGYTTIYSGQKTYNGVALLSKAKIIDVATDIPGFEDPQRRILNATIQNIRILNLYVPNGESTTSPKYTYKLNWLEKMHTYINEELKKYPHMIILGDFNIAPESIDVHDPVYWENKVLFSQPERAAFQKILQLGFYDCFRQLHPEEKIFSWWDYRLNAFKRNLGLRIDHLLASASLMQKCSQVYIDKNPRSLERPSDHTPVIAEFEND